MDESVLPMVHGAFHIPPNGVPSSSTGATLKALHEDRQWMAVSS